MRAQSFYSEMKDTVESLEKNVETFLNNRRSEGAQLLAQIERDKQSTIGGQADRERDRLKDIMERMSMSPDPISPHRPLSSRPSVPSNPTQTSNHPAFRSSPNSPPFNSSLTPGSYRNGAATTSPASAHQTTTSRELYQPSGIAPASSSYNPMAFPNPPLASPPPPQSSYQQYPQHVNASLPHGYVPPPPPPGPPPNAKAGLVDFPASYPAGPGGYAQNQPSVRQSGRSLQQSRDDPWAGLNAWK